MQDKEKQNTEILTLEKIIKSFLKPFIIGCIFISAKFITNSDATASGGAILIVCSLLYLAFSLFKLFMQNKESQSADKQ